MPEPFEFCWTQEKNFYFMEMNVRLQVEHAVTEQISRHRSGQVADPHRVSGVPLDFTLQEVCLRGSSIECRINARRWGTVKMLHVHGRSQGAL
jgi:acetyl-CoA carboxylase biotin carboxylase subunit